MPPAMARTEQLESFLATVQRRIALQRLLAIAVYALTAACTAVCVVIAGSKIVWLRERGLIIAVVVGIGLALAAAAALRRKITLFDAAAQVDAAAGLQERAATAVYCYERSPSTSADAVMSDAARHCEPLDPKQLCTIAAPRAAPVLCLLLLIAFALVWVPPRESLVREAEARRRLALSASRLAAAAGTLDGDMGSDEVAQELRELADRLGELTVAPPEARDKLGSIGEKIERIEDELQPSRELAEALAEALGLHHESLSGLKAELERLASLPPDSEEANAIAEALAASTKAETSAADLPKVLREMAEALDRLASLHSARKQIRAAMQDASQSGDEELLARPPPVTPPDQQTSDDADEHPAVYVPRGVVPGGTAVSGSDSPQKRVPYSWVLSDYKADAEDAVQRDGYAPKYRRLVREYFDGLETDLRLARREP